MTDGQNKPTKTSDDDWEMSEPEPELNGEELEITSPPEELDQQVSSLYDPLHTDELEGWDINTADLPESPVEEFAETESIDGAFESPDQSDQIPIEVESEHPLYGSPPNQFEIITPEQRSAQSESWEMGTSPAPGEQDTWKMPEPEFRRSEGILVGDLGDRARGKAAQLPVVDENLSGIYSPPDAVEEIEETSEGVDEALLPNDEDFESEEFDGEFVAEEDLIVDEELSEYDLEEQTIPMVRENEKSKSKTFIFLGIGIVVISLVAAAILLVGYFFYYTKN